MKALYIAFTHTLPECLSTAIVKAAASGYTKTRIIIEDKVCHLVWDDIQEVRDDLVVVGLRIEE